MAIAPATPLSPPDARPRRSLRQRYWLRRAAVTSRCGDDVRAFTYAARAAMAGDPDAQATVAAGYLSGKGVPASLGEATRWFERAAAGGHVDAMVALAKLAVQVSGGSGPDYAACRRWAERAVAAGSIEGTLLLANLLLFAPTGERDLGAARALFREVAATGHAAGCFGLALALLQGDPDAAARDEVVSLIETAACQRLPMAVYLAGVISELGLGRPADPTRATRHYRLAAETGIRAAQTRLGVALLHGIGTARDAAAAETWLRKAGLAGDAAAAALVGEIYAFDGDLPPNEAEAAIWFRRAAELGHVGAAAALASVQATVMAAYRDKRDTARWTPRAPDTGSVEPSDDPATLLTVLPWREHRTARSAGPPEAL